MTLYENDDDDNKRLDTNVKKVEVYCDNEEVISNYENTNIETENQKMYYKFSDQNITVYNIPNGIHNLKIKYTYKTQDVVQQYNDSTVLRLDNNTFIFSKINYNIIIPKNNCSLKTNSKKVKVDKIVDNKYVLEISEKLFDYYIEVRMDKGIIKQGKVIDKNIQTYNFLKLFNNEKIENIIILNIIGILTLILFIVVIILTRKTKVTGYVREYEMLLDPILAESIIDRKSEQRN